METKKLASEAIKDHFKVVGVEPGEIRLASGEIVDLTTISLERAKELAEQGFPYLKAKKKDAENSDSTETKPNRK